MIRHFPLLVGIALLGGCAPAPSSAPTSTSATPEVIQSITRDVRVIDNIVAKCYCPETKKDDNQKETTTAYRNDGVIRKVVVVRDSEAAKSMAEYYFTEDRALRFAMQRGEEREHDGRDRLTSVTNLDATYYFENGVLVAVRSSPWGFLAGNPEWEQEVEANAAEAVARFVE